MAEKDVDLTERVRILEEYVRQLQDEVRRMHKHGHTHSAGGEDEVRYIRSGRTGAAADRPAQGLTGDEYFASDTGAYSRLNASGTWVAI